MIELKRWLLLISVVLLSFQVVYAAEGIGMLEVPTGSISTVDTDIEATIENWGYDRIFVALPEGWTINVMQSSARSFQVRETGLWRIYGMPYSRSSMLGRGEVFTVASWSYTETPVKIETTIGDRQGWWLRPNEGLLLDIRVDEISTSGGVIDPVKIERENPSIRVTKWYESFLLEVEEPGLITAPWIVEGAALVESRPAMYSSSGSEGATVYYEKYQEEVMTDVPAWDEWFDLKNSLVYMMTKTALATIDLEFLSIEDADDIRVTITPVWKVENWADITYAYEWKSYRKVEGIGVTALDIPEWFELF